MSFSVRVENDVVQLPHRVADGLPAENTLPAAAGEGPTLLELMKDFVGVFEGPSDMAHEHDHYASGAPKRDRP